MALFIGVKYCTSKCFNSVLTKKHFSTKLDTILQSERNTTVFLLIISSKNIEAALEINSLLFLCIFFLQSKEGVYGGVCEYELVCDSSPPRPLPFPPCVHTTWGPGDSAVKYGLTPLQNGAIFCTVGGLAEVRFRMPKELRFTAKLKSNDRDEKALAGFIMNRVVGNTAVFTVRYVNKCVQFLNLGISELRAILYVTSYFS